MNNTFQFRACLLSCLLLIASLVRAGLPDAIDEIRPGIVAVGTLTPPKQPSREAPAVSYRGSGFAVGNGRQVITTFHTVSAELDARAGETLAVFVGRGEAAAARPARVLRSDPDHDLTLLEIGGDPLPALRLAGDAYVREGEEVAFTGFPIGMVLGLYPVTHRGIVSVVTPVVIPAMSADRLSAGQAKRLRAPFDVYQLDAIAYPGSSGSPVYGTGSVAVIGVVNSVFVKSTKEAILKDPSGIAYAIPVRYVRELMAREE